MKLFAISIVWMFLCVAILLIHEGHWIVGSLLAGVLLSSIRVSWSER